MNTSEKNTAESLPFSPIIFPLDLSKLLESPMSSLDLSRVHELNPNRYPFLLESVAKGCTINGDVGGENLGQFDILFAYPQETLQLSDPSEAEAFTHEVQSVFSSTLISQNIQYEWPFMGGWFAYFSYDYAQVVEPVLELPKSNFPLANMTRIPAAIMVNHDTQAACIMVEPSFSHCLPQIKSDIVTAFSNRQQPEELIEELIEKVELVNIVEEDEEKYLNGIGAIKDYILSGDIFQVNVSRQWQVTHTEHSGSVELYRALRQSNPAPFAALAHFGNTGTESDWQVISSSPERLVKYQYPWVETRPIAGTRKRGMTEASDQALVKELIDHPKERAEHIMLIDLERNDLGRICEPGTVEVNELMVVETYEHVHHIVSNVRGELREGLSPLDIIHALFPGGTITGCPKIRCMEIIAELEQMPREAYTGSLGYINLDGSMDLNILIRTMMSYQEQGRKVVQFRAGAGIVADSVASAELVETRHKAKGLIRAFSKEGQ